MNVDGSHKLDDGLVLIHDLEKLLSLDEACADTLTECERMLSLQAQLTRQEAPRGLLRSNRTILPVHGSTPRAIGRPPGVRVGATGLSTRQDSLAHWLPSAARARRRAGVW